MFISVSSIWRASDIRLRILFLLFVLLSLLDADNTLFIVLH